VLGYSVGVSGWTDDLTSFHEEAAGSSHPIDRASRRHAVEELKRHAVRESAVILEVGCSSGFLLQEIHARFPETCLIGADYVRGPLDKLAAEWREVPLLQFDLTDCPLPDRSVDAVVMLNVLEHIEDDAAAVRHVYRILKPGGTAIIEVPAGPHLYDVYDRLLMHHRRYTLSGLCRLLQDAGFTIARRSHLGCFLYPAFSLVKRYNRRFGARPESAQKARVAANIRSTSRSLPLEVAAGLETFLSRWVSFPVGIRCVVTAVRPPAMTG